MRKPDFKQTLRLAAGYRIDVKKFTLKGSTYHVVMYEGSEKTGTIAYETYPELFTFRAILTELLGAESPNLGTRPQGWHDARNKLFDLQRRDTTA